MGDYPISEGGTKKVAPKKAMQTPMFKRPAGGGGGGGGGKKDKKPSNKNANEPEETRLECTVTDPDLQAEFGDTMETMDNIYIVSKAQALEVAVRRFQRIRMGSRVFKLDVVYSPCLGVNKVVNFRIPLTSGVGESSPGGTSTTTTTAAPTLDVTGLITTIGITYDQTPSATMTLTIEPFKVVDSVTGTTNYIGVTEYAGCNEIDDPCGMEV
jgi:hypothetical protein